MKTGTTCARCANAAICPAYDTRMFYGFCQGFVGEPITRSGSLLPSVGPAVEDLSVNLYIGMDEEQNATTVLK